MKKIAMFDTKPYDKCWFDKVNENQYEIHYFESKLNEDTVSLTKGYEVVCAFVNDDINTEVVVVKLKDTGSNRNPSLFFNFHPVRYCMFL